MGLACSLNPSSKDDRLLIGSWWFDYNSGYTTDLIIFDMKQKQITKRVPGHTLFPVYTFWIENDTKAISADCVSEIICWNVSDEEWTKLFILKASGINVFLGAHGSFEGFIKNRELTFWSEEVRENLR